VHNCARKRSNDERHIIGTNKFIFQPLVGDPLINASDAVNGVKG